MLDRLNDWFDKLLMYALALWALFWTLPSLDKSLVRVGKYGEIITTHPTRGTPGSCYVTSDGQHYVRTGGGVRKVGKVLGAKLIARSLKIRRKAIARRVVVALWLFICVAGLVALHIS